MSTTNHGEGNIEAPYDMPPQNCGFAGNYLYVTGRDAVWRVRTLNAAVKNRGKQQPLYWRLPAVRAAARGTGLPVTWIQSTREPPPDP